MVQESPRTADGGAGGSGSGGGSQGIPVGVKKTVQSIKEIVWNHSDVEIYAMLKETNMDPNETAQKLLNQDPFHEVKRKRDKKKETGHRVFADTRKTMELAGPRVFSDNRRPMDQAGPRVFADNRKPMEQAGPRVFADTRRPMEQAGHRVFADTRRPMEQAGHRVFADNRRPMGLAGRRFFPDNRRPMEQNVQWSKPNGYWDRNAYNRGPPTGVSREFRVVRDNRIINSDPKSETSQLQASDQQVQINVPQKNSGEVFTKQKQSDSTNNKMNMSAEGVKESHASGSSGAKSIGVNASDSPLLPEESQKTVSGSTLRVQGEVKNSSSAALASSTSTNSVVGVYSSSSDPVHVPSPDSRTAGTVGAIRREVGAVGVRRPSSDRISANSLVSNKTHSVSSLRKDVPPPPAEFVGHTTPLSTSTQPNQTAASNTNTLSIPSRPSTNSQHNNKLHQQSTSHQKAVAPSMEWKPKSSKKPNDISSSVVAMPSTLSASCADTSTSLDPVDATGLSEKLSQVNVAEKQHVIIPQHLRVPESERMRLTFGTFGDEFESSKGLIFGSIGSSDDHSLSVSAVVPVGSGEDASPADEGDYVDDQESDSPTSDVESDRPPSGNNESFTENLESYAEIGLVQSHSPPYSSSELPQLQNPSSLPNFPAYNTVPTNYPFFRTVLDDNVRGEVLASSSEVHAAISSTPATVAVTQQQPVQQQQQQQQQQQSVAQMYPQLQISPFPNFVPYRQMFSPVYVPPMAMPNYPNTPSYPHPSNGSSYLLMPGGSSHLTGGGLKYAASQYKPVPAGTPGYASFTNPAGFTISTPASIGTATGLEDVSRIKYKDTNVYVPNAQPGESTDIWIQPPREVPGLQTAPYYNLPGQAAHPAFMQTHGGHGSFNASSQQSHVQYPGLYHQPQPGTIPNPHHMVHQQVNPGFGGGVGVGVAAPGPQVGTYQQPHLNWAPNF